MYGKRQDLTSEPNHGIEQVYFSAIVARLDAIAIIDPIANAVREHGMKAKKPMMKFLLMIILPLSSQS